MGSHGGFGQSKDFLVLVKSIGETRSKVEEDRIVLREIETLKRQITEPDIPKRKMKEFIIRLVYVEMLGHDASFGYIHVVKMTHDDNLLLKRTGFLAVTLFLNEDHDLIILIMNTIQKDLKSDNYLVVCAALNAVWGCFPRWWSCWGTRRRLSGRRRSWRFIGFISGRHRLSLI
ncbi:AP-4 complex subunit epsilon [Camellia lanceoleosa]|uniref:AP-4 complex subunit epsilon n=1 Tax=Camellia lanceoleosa TaxID=1840588 RepID=A0ACC0G536_9ERIC|nr:AP-4 complex subunit epsilon [Camellia lanceoleosa]